MACEEDVEQAIRRLVDAGPLLTIDQRLQIAALLTQPQHPIPAIPPHHTETLVLTAEEQLTCRKSAEQRSTVGSRWI